MRKTTLILIILMLLGFIVRYWKLTKLPFPPDGDEIAFAYYGWSLANFGTDEFGNRLPLAFSSIGDFKYPGLAYLNILPAVFFGTSDITSRFWSLMSGLLGIPLIYYFSFYLTKQKLPSILSALFFAISPWSIIESRIGYENHIAFVLALAGIVLIWPSTLNIKYKTQIASLLFIISILTYAATRIFIPLYLFVLVFYSFIDSNFKKVRLRFITLFLLTTIFSVGLLLNPTYRGRADENVWKMTNDDSQNLESTYHAAGISEVKVHPRITWLLNNKFSYAGISFLQRYTEHFSSDFLFFKGEASDENIPGMGVLLFTDLLLLPVGAFLLYKNRKGKSFPLFAWLLLAPIPSALTSGGAHINRASILIVPLSILSGYGFFAFTNLRIKFIRNLTIGILTTAVSCSFLYMLHQYFIVKPYERPWYKQQVNKELTEKVLSLLDKYNSIVVTDDDYIFYLFYGGISAHDFLENSEIQSIESGRWERVNSLYNINFKMPYRCPLSGKENTLYVCEGDEIPQNSKLIDLVRYKDGFPAYSLIEFFPLSKRLNPLPSLPDRVHYMVGVEKPDGNPDGIIPKDADNFW